MNSRPSVASASFGLVALDSRFERVAEVRKMSPGLPRFVLEFLNFGLENARACLFAGLSFSALALAHRSGVLGLSRYDVLLLVALAIQPWMIWSRLETPDELKAIMLFHVVGLAL